MVSLLRKEKKKFYHNLNTNISPESRTFWKTVKLFLGKKFSKLSNITLIEDNQIFSQDKQITKIFNAYFISIPNLNMPVNQEFECSDLQEEDPLLRIIGKYQNHSDIKLIKSKNKFQTFEFRDTNIDEIKKSIENLDPKETSQKCDRNTNVIQNL